MGGALSGRNPRLVFVWSSLALAGLLVLLACGKPSRDEDAEAEPDAKSTTAEVQVESLTLGLRDAHLEAYGTIEYAADALRTLSVPVEARVLAARVQPGESVLANAVLLELAPSPGAALELKRIEAELRNARSEWQKLQRLRQVQLATNSELSAAQLVLSEAQTRAAALEIAPQLLAPSDGVVVEVMVKAGDVLAANTPLLKLAQSGDLQLRFGVAPRETGRIQAGQALEFSLLDGSNAAKADSAVANVSKILQGLDPQTQLISVLATLPKTASQAVQAGAPVKINLRLSSDPAALSVPNSALLVEDQEMYVFVIVDGVALKQVVAAGDADAKRTTIISGLKPGDAVVIGGANVLSAGMPVRIAPASAQRAPPA